MNESNQLDMADELEKTLDNLGIQVQPRFDIPLARRLLPISPKADQPAEKK